MMFFDNLSDIGEKRLVIFDDSLRFDEMKGIFAMIRYLRAIVLVLVAILLVGCAATDMVRKGATFNPTTLGIPQKNADDYKGKKLEQVLSNLLMEPYDSTGVRETSALIEGNVTCFKHVPFPEELKKEQPVPERISWFVLTVAEGYEYFSQILKSTRKPTADLVVDGNIQQLRKGKSLIISTRAKLGYPLASEAKGIPLDRDKLMADPGYRRSVVETYGTPLANFEASNELIAVINTWNRFQTSRGYLLTPLPEERFRERLSINPGYTHSQRLATEEMTWEISTDPMGMLIQDVFINNKKAAEAPTTGWDFDSLKSAKPRGEPDEDKKD